MTVGCSTVSAPVDLLVTAMRSRSLLLHHEASHAARAAMAGRGVLERRRLRQRMGPVGDRLLLRETALDRADEHFTRVLGFGARITDFAVAPIVPSATDRDRLAQLGALANLIVSIYDVGLDRRQVRLLTPTELDRQLDASTRRNWIAAVRPRHSGVAFRYLVGSYLGDVDALGRDRHTDTPAFFHHVVRTMYTAESATAKGAGSTSEIALQRKSALPFVVMGMPSWYLGTPSRSTRRSHLRWLYRLGSLFGWVDDWVDLPRDIASGQPNRVALATRDRSVSPSELAERVGDLARLVQDDWDRTTSDLAGHQSTLPAALGLWLNSSSSPP